MKTSTGLIVIVILSILSFAGAYILFKILDSQAQGKFEEFTVGGALVGFIILFRILYTSFRNLKNKDMQVHLVFDDVDKSQLDMASAKAFYRRNNSKKRQTDIIDSAKNILEPH